MAVSKLPSNAKSLTPGSVMLITVLIIRLPLSTIINSRFFVAATSLIRGNNKGFIRFVFVMLEAKLARSNLQTEKSKFEN